MKTFIVLVSFATASLGGTFTMTPSQGPATGGNTVTASGDAINNAGACRTINCPAIFFDGIRASVLGHTATSLDVIAPPHAPGPVDVAYVSPEFVTTTMAHAYTYIATDPQVVSVAPVSGPSSGGTIVTFTGSGFHDDHCRITCASDRVFFGGEQAAVRFPADGVMTAVTPPHAPGSVDIAIINPNGERLVLPDHFTYVQSTPLSLRNGRFAIETSAVNRRDGRVSAGTPVPYNDKFGFFTFPELTADTENPEVFVKIVGPLPDGSYLFFYGGLTDFEYTVTVRDSATGRSRSYMKPAGEYRGDVLIP